MNRFRKKSDAKRNEAQSSLQYLEEHESLPVLPPASDFRTSLILPDLSRRFTLLRTSSGEQVSLDDLKSRFAEQRAKGAENQISEEEESMILDALGRMRAKNSRANERGGEEGITDTDYQTTTGRDSVQSANTISSTVSPASARSTKRYSNNLFGSGRFRDYTYVRSVASQKAGSTRSGASLASESSLSYKGINSSYADSLRPATPDSSLPSSSVQSSPGERTSLRSAPLIPPASYAEHTLSVAEYRISKTLGPSALKRASLALEDALQEMDEDEAEDEVVMPRSAPAFRTAGTEQNFNPLRESDIIRLSATFEAGTAISSDRQVLPELDDHRISPRASPIPSRTLPGYIPGMPRPMTPRSALDLDDQRSHSTTPRATSPVPDSSVTPLSLASGLLRRESNASSSRQPSRPTSPPTTSPTNLPRSINGRFTPEEQRIGESFSIEFDNPANSSILGRRRPASPLSGVSYQPMAVSSRPGTPSNVTWTPSTSQKTNGHNRNGSWVSDGGSSDIHGLERAKSTARSLRSPALPDSPTLDRGGYNNMNVFGSNYSNATPPPENRPPSTISAVDLGSPNLQSNRNLRSITPTQPSPTSPTSPNYDNSSRNGSRRSSKQNAPSSPFNLGSFHPLVFPPIANSSRSSLESAGSSYHSWDAEQRKDRITTLFSDVDPQQPVWHEDPVDRSATPGDSPDDRWDAEDIIKKFAGLSKSDFLAIQEKLVGVAVAKTATPDIRDRAPSLRRRRPSTSQSNHSLNGQSTRIASPPQTHSPIIPPANTSDQSSKAHALLTSVVNSIQSSPKPPIEEPIADGKGDHNTNGDVSPSSLRNRALAKALFGQDPDSERSLSEQPSKVPPVESAPINDVTDKTYSSPTFEPPSSHNASHNDSSFTLERATPTSLTVSPYLLTRNPSTPKIPMSPVEQAELAKEVQRRTDVAMAALRKSPSNPKFNDANGSFPSRKKISPHQISEPRLVSASTSVDTIPSLPPPLAGSSLPQSTSKLGQRIRKLRGTLRAKPPPPAEEVAPYPLNHRTPPSSQTVHYDPIKLGVPGGSGATSATDAGRFRVPVPSPPASAGPGLKGFMARFRGKQRTAETPPDEHRTFPLSPVTPTSSAATPQHTERFQHQDYPHSSEALPSRTSPHPSTTRSLPTFDVETSKENTGFSENDEKMKQFFNAASNIGLNLDQAELSDLLARKASTSSRSTDWTLLTRNNSATGAVRQDTRDESLTARVQTGRQNAESPSIPEETVVRKLSIRKVADPTRRPREGQRENTVNAVIRRTIIFPSETKPPTADLGALARKNSKSRRRASATSVSSRSVHDRAPTPPPPRSPTSRHFSNDGQPPMPQLPFSLLGQSDSLRVPAHPHAEGPIEKSSSTYDSLYEMYTGENKGGNSVSLDAPAEHSAFQDIPNPEPGQAVEVLELANGETIWSIVNGLRDDDAESVYGSRASFASEYSNGEPNRDGLQVFFKEHGRTGSKGSNNSFLSRKKALQGKARPETKVFYSSSAQIGRLIENLSQGMESGSFNFLPHNAPGRSTTSSISDVHWTVEERLEHMLGSISGST